MLRINLKTQFNNIKRSLALVGILGAFALLPACTNSDASSEIGENITTEELIDAPVEIAGREVTVRSTVDEVLGDSVLSINNPRIFSDGSVLVINDTGATFALPESGGVDIQLTGDVVASLTPELEAKLNLNLDDEFYSDYRNKPVVVAKSLALAPDPAEISANPNNYYSQVIAIEGEIEDVYGMTSFTLDEDALFGGEDVLVVGVPGGEQLEGQTVVVTGTLRPFIAAEFERDYDLDWDANLTSEIEAEFSERPVMVAKGLYSMTE